MKDDRQRLFCFAGRRRDDQRQQTGEPCEDPPQHSYCVAPRISLRGCVPLTSPCRTGTWFAPRRTHEDHDPRDRACRLLARQPCERRHVPRPAARRISRVAGRRSDEAGPDHRRRSGGHEHVGRDQPRAARSRDVRAAAGSARARADDVDAGPAADRDRAADHGAGARRAAESSAAATTRVTGADARSDPGARRGSARSVGGYASTTAVVARIAHMNTSTARSRWRATTMPSSASSASVSIT